MKKIAKMLNFKAALQLTKDKLLSDPNGPRILNINCWNEWTEGSYLEPDLINGMGYLEAVKEVFINLNFLYFFLIFTFLYIFIHTKRRKI